MSTEYHRRNIDLINSYLDETNWKVRENSNMGFSLTGLAFNVSSELMKNYWLYQVYPEYVRAAHKRGDIHINDLGSLSAYCVGHDLEQILLEGFCGVEGKVESNPPRHFRTTLGQIVNFLYTIQNEVAGANAISSFDTYLAPFIRYDNLSREEVKQSLQEFIYNMNVCTRSGFQCPFSNITLDLTVSSAFRDKNVIVGGEYRPEKYSDFQPEMDILNDCLFEVMAKGDSKGRIFSFPVITINITKDFDWDNKNLKHFWDSVLKYGLPNFSNFVNSDLNPDDVRSLCCRLRLDNKALHARGGGLFGANPKTGSQGIVTINLNRLGHLSKSKEEFMDRLSKTMDIVKDSLEIKRKVIEDLADRGLYPYLTYYFRDMKSRFGKYFHTFFSTIGLIGMNEACINLLGKSIDDEECVKFTQDVLSFMNDRIIEYQHQTGNLYNIEQTPGEGSCHSLAIKDKRYYPSIIVNGTEDSPYLSNSTHLPVNYADDIFDVLDHQNNFADFYTGGSMVHLFIGEQLTDVEAVKNLIRVICDTYKIPYFSLTPTFSICPRCGYRHGEVVNCPDCGSECEIYSRVVGYFRPVKNWNKGKQQEFQDRNQLKTQVNPF